MAAIRTYEVKQEGVNEANIVKVASLRHAEVLGTMRRTLNGMKPSKEGELYVHVWKIFKGKGSEPKGAGEGEGDEEPEAESWRIVSELALRSCRG